MKDYKEMTTDELINMYNDRRIKDKSKKEAIKKEIEKRFNNIFGYNENA